MRSTAPLALLALVSLCGCYESFPAVRVDGGDFLDGMVADDATLDGSSGPIDTGPLPLPDPCVSGETVPPYEGPGCSGTTVACLASCSEPGASPTCTTECIERDPECRMCVNQTTLACGNQENCQSAWDTYACCSHQRCSGIGPGADRLACGVLGECAAELEAYFACLDSGALLPCQDEVQRCFGGP